MPAKGVQTTSVPRWEVGTSPMHAIIVAGGDPPDRAALDATWPGWDDACGLVVAADRGALTALALGFRPDLVVGDVDSLDPADARRIEAAGIPMETVQAAKDETDTELAIRAALARGATRITILGALGGPRLDHALANVALLGMDALAGPPAAILDGRTRVRLLAANGDQVAELPLPGRIGDLVSLIPLGIAATGVTTSGLAWPLDDADLPAGPARGVSNVRTAADARVRLRSGRLLVVEVADDRPHATPQHHGGPR